MKKILLVTLLCVWAVIGYCQSQAFNAEVLYSQEILGYNYDVKRNNDHKISEHIGYTYSAFNEKHDAFVLIMENANVLSPNYAFMVAYFNAEKDIDEKNLKYLFDVHRDSGGYTVMYRGCLVHGSSAKAYSDICGIVDSILRDIARK